MNRKEIGPGLGEEWKERLKKIETLIREYPENYDLQFLADSIKQGWPDGSTTHTRAILDAGSEDPRPQILLDHYLKTMNELNE